MQLNTSFIKNMEEMRSDTYKKRSQCEQVTLVFPSTHPDGQKYLESAREHGENVVAASSAVLDTEFSGVISEIIVLPYIYEPTFNNRFLELVRERNITQVFAPVWAVYSWLKRYIAENNLAIHLIGDSPFKREITRCHSFMDKAANYKGFIDECADGASDLSNLEIASVFRMAENIYGESNEHKIAAIMGIFSTAPKGDVVEIGALVGKSAAVLTLLAKRYQIGNVLVVDPWQIDPWQAMSPTQHNLPSTVRSDMAREWDNEALSQDFVINTLPVGLGSLNYIRQESAKGFEIFRENLTVVSQAFNRVDYQGKIAVIHIDGSHDYDNVKLDCELWLPLMAPDGWLILDDYLWVHGDGPHRVGDALLELRIQDIERSFVCGKALFVKFGGCEPL